MSIVIDTKYKDRVHNIEIRLELNDSELAELRSALGSTYSSKFAEIYRCVRDEAEKYDI